MFEHIEPYHGDPILSLMESYTADIRVSKVNLSIGLYYDEDGTVPFLNSVREAKRRLDARAIGPLLYLPMSGMAGYCDQVQKLIFAQNSSVLEKGKVATIQTLGGSGALKVGADFLKKGFPDAKVWVSDPTWENHIAIFEGAGFEVYKYPYYDYGTGRVDFDAMLDQLRKLEKNDIVLLHPCCHNPTGSDLSKEQWVNLIAIIKRKQLIPYLDMAYQGFGDGFNEDLYAIDQMIQHGMTFLLSNSFSKIFSLYGERIGALSVVCASREEADLVLGQLKFTVRKNYSSPPSFGARLIYEVLTDMELKAQWLYELEAMRVRIRAMRQQLYTLLLKAGGDSVRYDFLLKQKGMFSYTQFPKDQVTMLRDTYGIYLIDSGRMCVAGLNTDNLENVAVAMLEVDKLCTLAV